MGRMAEPEIVRARAARHTAVAREYADFYGAGAQAPMGEIAVCGDLVAAETMREANRNR